MANSQQPLLQPYLSTALQLSNRIVMASLTRGRATNKELAPTELHAAYYSQRASAGLILTESAWVSEKAISFINIPGIYSEAQIKGWQLVTNAVHEQQGKIFLQIAHSGSVSHPYFFNGELPKGPSAINPQEKVFTPSGFTDTVTPDAFTLEEIKATIAAYKLAALHAKQAGFDGIELHAQLFTLVPQFLSAITNQRTDEYGGSIENRSRLLFELLDTVKEVYPANRIGVKFTPAAFNNGIIKPDEHTLPTYAYILNKLNEEDLAYVQIVGPVIDLKGTVLEELSDNFFGYFRKLYKGTLMANAGFDQESANALIASGQADLVSFGKHYIANPDLKERFEYNVPLAVADQNTYYAGEEKGYTDYTKSQDLTETKSTS